MFFRTWFTFGETNVLNYLVLARLALIEVESPELKNCVFLWEAKRPQKLLKTTLKKPFFE
jgi:hypothetical protein